MAKVSEVRVGMKLSDLAEGGGSLIPSDGMYLIKSARAEQSAYGKDTGDKFPLMKLVLVSVDAKNKPVKGEEPHILFYSAGDAKVFKAAADGEGFALVNPDVEKQISMNSNYGVFLKHVCNAGFDDSEWEGNLSRFDGMICRFHAVAAQKIDRPKAEVVAVAGAAGATPKKEYDKKLFVVEELVVDPAEDAPAPKSKKVADEEEEEAPAKTKKGKKPVEEDEEVEAEGDGELPSAAEFAATHLKKLLKGKKEAERAKVRIDTFKAAKELAGPDNTAFGIAVNNLFKDDAVLTKLLAKLDFELDDDNITAA